MAKRRKDRFLKEMSAISRSSKQRKAKRLEQKMYDQEEPWAEFRDSVEFRTREFNALGKDIGRGLVRETAGLGEAVLREGVFLATDFMTTLLTLGTAMPSASVRGGGRRRRRRRQ